MKLYHNPRCSKSRAALALLEARGIDSEVVLYLDAGIDAQTAQAIIERSAHEPHAFIRWKDAAELGLDISKKDAPAAASVAQAIAAHPRILERPILDTGTAAAIGRPIELIEALLS